MSPDEAEKALVDDGIPTDLARELALLGRRNLTALRRRLSRRPEFQQPLWAHPENARDLLPFFLIGAWRASRKGDLEVLVSLSPTRSADQLQDVALRWSREGDPPVRNTGDLWYVSAKGDSWPLLAPSLALADLERFEAAVMAVYGNVGPACEVASPPGLQVLGQSAYSEDIRRGLAETLAIMGARGSHIYVAGTSVERWAARIVNQLLGRAITDWRLWASISNVLPLLAEAAPDQFLTAMESGLEQEQPILKLVNRKRAIRIQNREQWADGGYVGHAWTCLIGITRLGIAIGIFSAAQSKLETIVFAMLVMICSSIHSVSSGQFETIRQFAFAADVEFRRIRRLLKEELPHLQADRDLRYEAEQEAVKQTGRQTVRFWISGVFFEVIWLTALFKLLTAVFL